MFDDTASTFTANIPGVVKPNAITVNTAATYTFQGPGKISGATGLTKQGTGTLIVLTNNDYTGPTTVAAGTLQIGNGGTIGSISSDFNGSGTLAFNRSDDVTYAGSLGGALNLTKNGSGILTLTGTNGQTGTVTLNAGVLSVGAPGTLGGNGAAVLFNGGTLRITATHNPGSTNQVWTFGAGGGTVEVAAGVTATKTGNTIAGSGSMIKTGDGAFFIGSNTSLYSGPVTVQAGRIVFTSNQLRSATGFTVQAGATYEINDDAVGTFNFAASTTLNLNGTGAGGIGAFRLTAQSATSPTTTFSNPVNLQSDSLFTQVNGTTGTSQLTSRMSCPGVGGLTKNGNGTMILTAANNTYSGGTTISAGTLRVTGQTGTNSGTGTGIVTVNTGGTLDGTGRVGGGVAVNNSGTLAPGVAAAGTLTVGGNAVLNTGGKLAVGAAAAGTNSSVTVEGSTTTFDFKNGSILDLALLSGFTNTAGASYTIIAMPTGGGANVLLNGNITTDGQELGKFIQGTGPVGPGTVVINPSGFTLTTGDTFTLSRTGDAVVLTFTPVPEPVTVLGLAAGALGLGGLVRRQLRKGNPAETATVAC